MYPLLAVSVARVLYGVACICCVCIFW